MVETKIRQGVQARLRALDSAAATLLPSRQQTGPKREDLELQLKAIETKIGAINRMSNAAKMTRTAPCVWWWWGGGSWHARCDGCLRARGPRPGPWRWRAWAVARRSGSSQHLVARNLEPSTSSESGLYPSSVFPPTLLTGTLTGTRDRTSRRALLSPTLITPPPRTSEDEVFDFAKGVAETFYEFINTFDNETIPAHLKLDALSQCAQALKGASSFALGTIPVEALAHRCGASPVGDVRRSVRSAGPHRQPCSGRLPVPLSSAALRAWRRSRCASCARRASGCCGTWFPTRTPPRSSCAATSTCSSFGPSALGRRWGAGAPLPPPA